MRIQIEGLWHTILGEGPSPSDLHHVYMSAGSVGRIQELYEGEVYDIYRQNGFSMVEDRWLEIGVSPRTLWHSFERVRDQRAAGAKLGPAIMHSLEVWQGRVGLWLPVDAREQIG